MANVILIYPFLDMDPSTQSKENFLLPLSMLYVATPLDRQHYQVHIIDMRFEPDWEKDLRKELRAEKPICVGISAMTGAQIKWGLEASKLVREVSPEIPIVWGGVHPTLLPEQTVSNKYVDIVVMGEGEHVIVDLVRALERKIPLDSLREGICFKKNGKPFRMPRKDFLDLNRLPELSYHLIDVSRYLNNPQVGSHFERSALSNLPMITSRGCPHACAYCYEWEFNLRKWRPMEVDTVIRRMRYLVETFNLSAIFFLDDNFFVNRKRAEAICRAKLKDQVLKEIQIFNANCRYDYVSKYSVELLKLFKEAGIRDLRIGAEAGSNEELKRIMKQSRVEQVIIANKKLKEVDIRAAYNFLVGFPGETIEETKSTLKLMNRLLEDNPLATITAACLFTPYPGTPLYHSAVETGWQPPMTLEDWSSFDFAHLNWWNSLGEKQAEFCVKVHYVSRFLDPKFIPRTSFKGLVARTYSRVIRWRIRHNLSGFMPEFWFKNPNLPVS